MNGGNSFAISSLPIGIKYGEVPLLNRFLYTILLRKTSHLNILKTKVYSPIEPLPPMLHCSHLGCCNQLANSEPML